ncbi:MAG: hypothetical protein IJT03_03965 [Clostridia bacterium]|nr:hypothetical protein [Clostridia bacterium]
MPSGRKRTHEEFINELGKITHTISVQEPYQKNTKPIRCRCLVCGYEWGPTPQSLLCGHGCPSCAGNTKLTHEEFIDKLKAENPNFESFDVLTPYKGMSGKVKCRCKICDTIWHPKANDLIRAKSGCPSCSGNIGFTHNRFIEDLCQKNPNYKDIIILSKYDGMLNRIKCKCKKCGREWAPLASSLMQGTGCPICAKVKAAERGREMFQKMERPGIINHDSFVAKFIDSSPYSTTIEITGTYKGAKRPIKCRCLRCGCEWSPIASALLRGTGCPDCSHSSTSFMEQFLVFAFRKALGESKVISRDKVLIGKEIDIYIPSKSFAIEIGSWTWHRDALDNDMEKIEACRKHDTRLIIIYDSCTDTTIENEDVWTYPIDLGSEKQCDTLKSIFFNCLKQMNIQPVAFDENDWIEIINHAYQASLRVTHDDFLAKLQEKNRHFRDIVVLSEYRYAREKIKCKCKKCGNEWETAASELLKGTGCPVCQIKAVGDRRSKKDQIIEWRKNHPNGSKLRCEKETGISRMTVYKWWKAAE